MKTNISVDSYISSLLLCTTRILLIIQLTHVVMHLKGEGHSEAYISQLFN